MPKEKCLIAGIIATESVRTHKADCVGVQSGQKGVDGENERNYNRNHQKQNATHTEGQWGLR